MDLAIWKWKNICVFGIRRTCRRGRNWFGLHLSNLSWAAYYISPRWINLFFLIIASKHLTGCEALSRFQSYRFIVKWIALPNNLLSCKFDSYRVWLKFKWMSKPNLSDLCRQTTKALFSFQLHTVAKLFFNNITIFKQSTDTNINQKMTSGVCWRPQALISTNL